jgi:hypothetical protein
VEEGEADPCLERRAVIVTATVPGEVSSGLGIWGYMLDSKKQTKRNHCMIAEKHREPIWSPEKHHEPNMGAANGLVTYAGTLRHRSPRIPQTCDLRILATAQWKIFFRTPN